MVNFLLLNQREESPLRGLWGLKKELKSLEDKEKRKNSFYIISELITNILYQISKEIIPRMTSRLNQERQFFKISRIAYRVFLLRIFVFLIFHPNIIFIATDRQFFKLRHSLFYVKSLII